MFLVHKAIAEQKNPHLFDGVIFRVNLAGEELDVVLQLQKPGLVLPLRRVQTSAQQVLLLLQLLGTERDGMR